MEVLKKTQTEKSGLFNSLIKFWNLFQLETYTHLKFEILNERRKIRSLRPSPLQLSFCEKVNS
tara:strand:+ start:256 stop:444 length:189 start_codon:yes stop_codon:yes gene_type:complete